MKHQGWSNNVKEIVMLSYSGRIFTYSKVSYRFYCYTIVNDVNEILHLQRTQEMSA